MNRSLWIETSPPETASASSLGSDQSFDAIVIGAGITGLTTARLLASDGLTVCVLEAGRVCSGVTAYTTAKVTALQRTTLSEVARRHGTERAELYAAANKDAVETVAELVARDGIECDFERAPACTYSHEDERVIETEHEACTRAGLPTRLDSVTELPYEVRAAVWLDDQAQIHPRKYCLGLADVVRAGGGTIVERARALDVREEAEGCVVVTSRGEVRGALVVMATLLPFFDTGAFFARAHPYRSYAMAARVDEDRPLGMYISAETPTRSVRSTVDGWLVVAGEGHKVGHDDDTRGNYERLEHWLRETFTVRESGPRWSAQDYESVDGLPYVGWADGNSKTLVATGFRKWGMSNGTAAAKVIADLVVGRSNPWTDAFDARRLAPGASIKKLVSENLDVGRRFVVDRLKTTRPRDADALGHGEGDVVELGDETVAAYRDDEGVVHAVAPTCTHLGCRVTLNTAERTWDCPCHGSRFDVDGHVLQGPATEDLARKGGP